jgi:hypothetical protein
MISESRFVESSKASTLNGSKGRRRCFSGGLTVPGHCSARTKPCGEEAIDDGSSILCSEAAVSVVECSSE